MSDITIICDRCGKIPTDGKYYNLSSEEWAAFTRWEESNICYDCMHSDPEYHNKFNIGNE